ncbi:MAG: ATP-binding protein [Treponema sp.]|nr:ATP-binding protein [Treponema sp.]
MIPETKESNLLLQTLNQVAAVLLDPEISGLENHLYSSMDMMIRAVHADRVSIWKNHFFQNELCVSQLYEWSEGNAPQQDAQHIENISYKKNIPDWEKILSSGQCVSSLTSDLEPSSRDYLTVMQVQSVFAAPIFIRDIFWGFIQFENCHRKRIFSDDEVAILRSCCLLIGNAFLRGDMNQDLQNNILELKALQIELENALDEAKAASRSKSAFLANMSHEIRTPMNSIIGFSELALDDDVSPKAKDYFNKILENSKLLLQILNDILDISKIETGKMELENIPFNLQEIFTACRTLIMPKVMEKGLTIFFHAEPVIGRRLYGDPTRLRQVFVNLLSNAVKFTSSGVINMKAALKDKASNTVTMFFEISDSGIGITEDQIKKILDPFMQAESGTTRKFGGSGLGLTITKNIIEMMGGTLCVDSTPGVGSRFSFDITFDTIDIAVEDNYMENIILDNSEKPVFKGEVLLCEDNTMNQQVVCEHLKRVGLNIVVASNGKEGVEYVETRARNKEKQFDLVLMDIHMPVMDGLEAAVKIIEINRRIPVVAMTANVMNHDREIYISKGMVDCVGKPFTSQELWLCLMKYIKPVGFKKENAAIQEESDQVLLQKLINSFVINNRDKFIVITEAINSGDIKLAHRMAHTLKSNAGQLKKASLQKIAWEVESALKNGDNLVTPLQMSTLEAELNAVIAELEPLVSEPRRHTSVKSLDPEEKRELLEKLEQLLEYGDMEFLSLIDDLLSIEGSDKLIQLMENLDFGAALKELAELRLKT